ncbi:MAG: hypothetical protein DYH17_14865 [Xanthomonadales bacterium PRO6]|nr:hypothetical protein [Xanthomonadales bacterium PRO6]
MTAIIGGSIDPVGDTIDTLETRHRDSLDFHDVGVWCVRDALQAAYDAGLAEGRKDATAARVKATAESKQ